MPLGIFGNNAAAVAVVKGYAALLVVFAAATV